MMKGAQTILFAWAPFIICKLGTFRIFLGLFETYNSLKYDKDVCFHIYSSKFAQNLFVDLQC